MEVIGLICEYNPFHNGHLYHINKIKEKYPDSILILVLNGYFLERGEISIISKFDKVKIALENKIDIVISLPVLYGCQAADNFALAAVTLLDALMVDKIIFGSETNDVETLFNIAKKEELINQNTIKKHLKKGDSYPQSLNKVLEIDELKSNDLLGVSYCKAILKNKFKIELETIKRTNDFNDILTDQEIISAKNIREKIKNKKDINKYLPEISKDCILNIDINLYFNILKQKILTDQHLNEYLDVTEGIENLLIKEIKNCDSYEEFLKKIKSKRYSTNRLQRMLIHIYLGILKEDANKEIDYINILGFNLRGKNYLKQNKKCFKLKTKVDSKSKIRDYELRASILYSLLTKQNIYEQELKNKPIYIKTADCLNESNQK